MHLTAASDAIQVITSAAVTVDVIVDWADLTHGDTAADDRVTPGRTATAITTAATTSVLAGPSSGYRKAKYITVRNKHATDPVDITVQLLSGGTAYQRRKETLTAGKELHYTDILGFQIL